MKAVRIHEFGGPEVLKVEDVPTPEPGEGEVLVQVHASSVNPLDYKIRSGAYLGEDRLPIAMGRDIAGLVIYCGPGVQAFEPGDAVYALLPEDRGGYAEYVAIGADIGARMPAKLDYVQAAAVPLAALTAWQGLFDHGGLKQGQTVLIHGAGGGVGHFAVQFARARGARVIATCRGEDRDFVRHLGASTVVDYQHERFEDVAHDVDLVLDLVGGETQDRSWSVLKEGGVLVSTLAPPDQAKAAEHKARGLSFKHQPNGPQLAEITRLIDAGQVLPNIDRVFPLAQSAAAEDRLEHEHVRGKIVLSLE
jgi:NADPH:quinone reductase-like Zn-dependent oxidoreductase